MYLLTKNLDTVITILTAIVFPILGFLVFKLFRGPRLEININFKGGSRKRGNVIDYPHDSDETPYAEDLTYNYNYRQDFDITVLNNSEIDAYDIKLNVSDLNDAKFHANGNTEFSPLPAHEEIELPCKFRKTVTAGYRNSPDVNELKKQIKSEVEVTTSATNKYRFKKFYSKYSDENNRFSFIRKW